MATLVRLERQYCLYPHCVLRPQFQVYSDDGMAQGEFCTRHARVYARRLDKDPDVDLYPSTPTSHD